MDDPVVVTESDGGEELESESLDFRGEEGVGHIREKGFEIVLDEIHNDENPDSSEYISWLIYSYIWRLIHTA